MKRLLFIIAIFFSVALKSQVVSDTAKSYTDKGDTILTIQDHSFGTFTYPILNVRTVIKPKTGTANIQPNVNAGASQSITLPVNSVTLNGTASDPDGTIQSVLWVKNNSSGTIITPSSLQTSVIGLTQGNYTFTLTATDNSGASKSSTMIVTVNPAPDTTGGSGGVPINGYNTLLYHNGFDKSSDLSSNQLGIGSTVQNSISTSVFKSGTGSFKSVVQANSGQVSGGWRSEQQYDEKLTPNGQETATEYDEYFESLGNVAGLSIQWHGNATGTSGQTSMWTQSAQFMVQRNTTGTAGSPNIYQSGTLMKIETGIWYHFRWEIKFSSGNDGYERCYINGNLYYSVTGKTSDGSGQYLKVGQNLFASPKINSVLYIDNLNVWKK